MSGSAAAPWTGGLLVVCLLGVGVPAAAAPPAAPGTGNVAEPVRTPPSADLLLPYFEADLEGGGATTFLALTNDLSQTVSATATVHSNWGIPVLSVGLSLKPREVLTLDLQDWFVSGDLPGRRDLSAAELAHLQAALTGGRSPDDGLFYSTALPSGRGAGSITIRTQGRPRPVALRGEYFLTNPGQGSFRGDVLADIGASASPARVCFRHVLRRLPGAPAGGGLQFVLWMDAAGHVLPAPVPADRRQRVVATVLSRSGTVLDTRELRLLPVERVSLASLELPEPAGRIELATADGSLLAIVANGDGSGDAAYETVCAQTPVPPNEPRIEIVTLVNGQDANTPPGPAAAIGSTVTWEYRVSNAGAVALTQVKVTDDRLGAVRCPRKDLKPGQSMTCTARGTAEACQQKQVGTATGFARKRGTVTDQDPGHYFGDDGSAIALEVAVNGQDADQAATAPRLPAGSRVEWSYLVENTGTVRLRGIEVTDGLGGKLDCPRLSLAPGEFMTCLADGVAVAGLYRNAGTATAATACGTVSGTDEGHYFGESESALELRALTNGFDADFPPGPTIPVGGAVTWEYVVTNSGRLPLGDIGVTNDAGVAVTCPAAALEPGRSLTCIGRGTAVACQAAQRATATGRTASGQTVSATDSTHYTGENAASVRIELAVNGQDADIPPGPQVATGNPVRWTYSVTNTGRVALTRVTVSDDKGAVVVCPQSELRPGESMTCTAGGVAVSGLFNSLATVTGQPPCGAAVSHADAAYYSGMGDPGLQIRTRVEGQDADAPPGPSILRGKAVTWTYVVTNTGQLVLSGVQVTDSRGVLVTCPQGSLQPGQVMTCTATGTAQACQYDNLGTVTGRTPAGQLLTAVDPSHYFGQPDGALRIDGAVNGQDADTASGPTVSTGATLNLTYTVTNTGGVPLTGLAITDDDGDGDGNGPPVLCPRTTLAPGESTVCTATAPALEGQRRHLATATATPPCGAAVSAQDPSHYFGGGDGVLSLQTLTQGEDANDPPGPTLDLGVPVSWTYRVTNSGRVSLSEVGVTDSRGVTVVCPKPTLQAGETMTCSASGTARACQYSNLGVATGKTAGGQQVAASDLSHYFGRISPAVTLETSVNGSDADTAPGPSIPVGTELTWAYTVTNSGNAALTGVRVSDPSGLPVACPKPSLDPGEAMICHAFGTAAAGPFATTATVVATPPCALAPPLEVSARDATHYTGTASPGLQIQKLTNGQDLPWPGPVIPLGQPVVWSYVVTNTGQAPLTGIVVSDDDLTLTVTCPRTSLQPGEAMTCTSGRKTAAACHYVNVGTATAQVSGGTISVSDPSYYYGQFQAAVQIKTAVNGNDADTAPGPLVAAGATVSWTYLVTNLGNVPLSNVEVHDDQGAAVTCTPSPLSLQPGQSATCRASGRAVVGQFRNAGTVTADPPCGDPVSAQDASHYFGRTVGIALRKLTNGKLVDRPEDLPLPVGSTVTWSYIVTNTGSVTLQGIVVGDDKGVQVTCPQAEIPAGESMACTGTGAAGACAYTNTGTATGVAPGGESVSASATSHYTGLIAPAIDVETSVGNQDADAPPGPTILQGSPVTVTYVVKNTGDTDLTDVRISDGSGAAVVCPGSALAPEQSMTCTATFSSAATGPVSSVATASAQPPCGGRVSDTDPTHYTVEGPSIDIEVWTNGQDADSPPGPSILVGDPVRWDFRVTNTGRLELLDVTVTDTRVTVACPKATLQPGELMVCTVLGTAACGAYANTGTARGRISNGTTGTDTDASHYTGGGNARIDIEVLTNAEDADKPPGPVILRGAAVEWTYEVQNLGDVPLTNVTVTDSRGVTVTCPATELTAGGAMRCTASGVAVPGQYSNRGTATGQPPCGPAVSDFDDSHYKGPPVLEARTTQQLVEIWDDQGSGANDNVRIYRPLPAEDFCIVGDYGQGNYNAPNGSVVTVRVKENEDLDFPALTPPLDYQKIWDDQGSGADDDGSVWRPVPRPGYLCAGHVFQRGYDEPTPANSPGLAKYRCVRSDLMTSTALGAKIWDDQGSGADDNVSLFRVSPLNVLFANPDYDDTPEETTYLPVTIPYTAGSVAALGSQNCP